MSRIQQDQFVDDDEEECCPLCVEEFDLSDKNFRPCPCGYQICQFCFNNIKTTMNGLCPACRRPYNESTIEFKNITPEEMAKHKQQIAQKAKKNAAARQKEAQKAEADYLGRKHLAGLRVVQKNLVYVTGLTPTIREDRLLDTLRGGDYFGQYGKIIKIVVSKARENAQHQQSVGVYVTFARKEDAAACIAAVDGSQNGDRTLRAQYGTTKYCSAYLRGEQCNNRNCMFLHEPGEENDSFTRQDLSMMNSIQTQQPAQSSTSQSAPPAHRGPPVVAAPMNRQDSNDGSSPTQSGSDAPGLPATANWGSKAAQERRASRSTNASNPSPMTANAVPAQPPKPMKTEESPKKKGKDKDKSAPTSKSVTPQPTPVTRAPKPSIPGLESLLKQITSSDFKFVFSRAALTDEEWKAVQAWPPLIDPLGGTKRRQMIEKEKELALQREAESAQAASQAAPSTTEREEPAEPATAGGSLQLGGEPEESPETGTGHANQHAIAPPGQQTIGSNMFGQNTSLPEDFSNLGLGNRNLTQQQQQQLLLSKFQSNPQSAGLLTNFPTPQGQQGHNQAGNAPGHQRHTSRFSFANDSSSAASVQPVANQKLMNQQNNMMPKNSHFNQISQHQPLGGQFYTSGVQGPPPGLKATGTPPVSGGGMFGQGHGFATGGLGYGANAAGRNNNDAMYQDLLRGGRNMDGGARVADAGKRESMFPSFLNQHPSTSTPAPAPGLLSFPYGPSPGAYQESGSQKSKKKGKKHRHANTSSSGGGGVVDVQDPSILQARMHQGGAMAGQGLYGQGQDDQLFDPEEQVSFNVDALVSDNDLELLGRSTPINHQILEPPRRATPTIPPGFTVPAIPNSLIDDHPTRPLSRNYSSSITPAIPVVPVTPIRAATPVKSKKEKRPTGAKDAKSTNITEPIATPLTKPETPCKLSRKASSAKAQNGSEVAKSKAEEAPVVDKRENKPVPESPIKATPKGKAATKKQDASPQKDGKDKENDAIPATPASSKRQHPGKLDIAAATKASENGQSVATSLTKSDAHSKGLRTISLTSTNSVPVSPVVTPASTPAATSTGSPVKRSVAPRTIRVVPTPRSEHPPPLSAVSAASVPHVPTVEKLRSRQASIASLNQPGTPASELISDTASITSTSISRANSPPPIGGKVGTAPVRKKTKSQAKKERQERKRQITEEQETVFDDHKISDTEPIQAPIIGRKKKTKKPASIPKLAPTAPVNQPEPSQPTKVEEEEEVIEPKAIPAAVSRKTSASKLTASPPRKAQPPPAPEPEPASATDQAKDKREPATQAIIADLQRTGELLASTLEFFKPLSTSLAHVSRTSQSNISTAPPDLKIHFSEADLDALSKKKPVRLNGQDGKSESRTLITPQGKFFWGLTQELEEKALELEKHIEELKGQARFHPRKQATYPHAHNMSAHAQSKDVLPAIATALKEAGAKLGKSSTSSSPPIPKLDPTATLLGSTSLPLPPVQASSDGMPWVGLTKSLNRPLDHSDLPPVPAPPPQAQPQPQTPADAIAYLNQFVLPKSDYPSPNTPRHEMAAVGGPPGAGLSNMSVNVNKIAKAAKAVAEGGLGTEIEGMGVMAADLLGGVVVQGLEALVGAGLGFHSNQDLNIDGQGNVTLGGSGLDVQGLVNVIESGGGLTGLGGAVAGAGNTRRVRRSVLSIDEAEQAMLAAKKDHEALEKKLAVLIKRNKKFVQGVGRG